MPSRTLPFCFVAFNVITFSSDARAQENTNSTTTIETKTSTQVVEIKNDGKKYDARREDTVTKFVITREEIERHGDNGILNLLNRQPGIVNGQINGLQGYTLYLVDGRTPPRDFHIGDLIPSQIERIEIMRSAVAEFSAQAIGGIINIVMQRQAKQSLTKLELRGKRVNNDIRSDGATFTTSEKGEAHSYTLTTAITRNEANTRSQDRIEDRSDTIGYEEQNATNIRNKVTRAATIEPSLTFTPNSSDQVTWKSKFTYIDIPIEQKYGLKTLQRSLPDNGLTTNKVLDQANKNFSYRVASTGLE